MDLKLYTSSYIIFCRIVVLYILSFVILISILLLRVSEENGVPISNSYIGSLDDIQTALKPLNKSEKI